MNNIAFIRKMRELRSCMIPAVQAMKWRKGKKPSVKEIGREKNVVAASIINEMMGYIVERVADGDICKIPDKNGTMIYMGFNYPLAVERMKKKQSYPYREGITPAFIKISSPVNPRTYLSLLMAKPSREWLIDKINEGREYYQPIPLHATYHLDRKRDEMVAWQKMKKEKEWNTLQWTI
jgi:hypothetical protein